MAVQGKKINELTAIGTVSNETVLPAVYVSGTTVNSTANKISIEQISTKVQDDMSTALAGKQDTLVSGTNIKTINNESLLGSGNLDVDGLPSQSGQSGKFLTTDGTNASWAQVSISEGGADTSLSNLTDAGKIVAGHMSMPSDTHDDLTIGVSGDEYTAPADGYFVVGARFDTSHSGFIRLIKEDLYTVTGFIYNDGALASIMMPVRKGEKVKYTYAHVDTQEYFKFIYAKGSESEYTPS